MLAQVSDAIDGEVGADDHDDNRVDPAAESLMIERRT